MVARSGQRQPGPRSEVGRHYSTPELHIVSNQPSSMAPSIDVEDDVDPHDEDYAYHVRTFNRFLSTARYFAIHVGILLVALYFFAIGNQPVLGAILILCSIGLL